MRDDPKRIRWYIEHRLEYHVQRLDELKAELLPSTDLLDYDKIRETMETKGKIAELKAVLEFIDRVY